MLVGIRMQDKQVKVELATLMEKMRGDYLAELPVKIQALEVAIHDLGHPEHDQEALYTEIYRVVHSLKGTAGTYGIHVISTICRQFEDYLSVHPVTPVFRGTELTDVSLRYVAIIRHAIELCARELQDSYPEIDAQLTGLA